MNEKYEYENILTLTKSLITLYLNGVIESSNKNVRKFMDYGLKATLDLQDKMYQKMKKDGYYQVCNVKCSEINKTLTKLTKDEN